jgi:hypothetical protein
MYLLTAIVEVDSRSFDARLGRDWYNKFEYSQDQRPTARKK